MIESLSIPRIITSEELHSFVPLSSMQIWRLERAGMFPKRLQLSAKKIGWLLPEIEDWIASRNRGANPDAQPRKFPTQRAR